MEELLKQEIEALKKLLEVKDNQIKLLQTVKITQCPSVFGPTIDTSKTTTYDLVKTWTSGAGLSDISEKSPGSLGILSDGPVKHMKNPRCELCGNIKLRA